MLIFRSLTGLQEIWMVGKHRDDTMRRATIDYAEATDFELMFVRDHFRGIPFRDDAHRLIWRGESAQFLHDNIRSE